MYFRSSLDNTREVREVELTYSKKRKAKLINLILDYSIENRMSLEEIDDCMEEVSKIYYSDGLVIREKAEI